MIFLVRNVYNHQTALISGHYKAAGFYTDTVSGKSSALLLKQYLHLLRVILQTVPLVL
jgi:hypothetical protein